MLATLQVNQSKNSNAVAAGCEAVPADETEAPKILEGLVRCAEQRGASNVHLQMVGLSAQVAFRLDGLLTRVGEIPAPVAERVVGRVKFLARLKTYQELLPQDGRIDK